MIIPQTYSFQHYLGNSIHNANNELNAFLEKGVEYFQSDPVIVQSESLINFEDGSGTFGTVTFTVLVKVGKEHIETLKKLRQDILNPPTLASDDFDPFLDPDDLP